MKVQIVGPVRKLVNGQPSPLELKHFAKARVDWHKFFKFLEPFANDFDSHTRI